MAADNVILGEKCIYSTDCEKTQLNNNIIVCGSSGCGKTMSVSEPRLLETVNSSLIITMSKQRLISKYTPLFRKRGYRIWELNFMNPEASNVSYDPLAYVKTSSDITFLATSIVKANPQKKNTTADPYWDESAISLLSAEIAYILETENEPSLVDVLELHDSIQIEDNGGMITTSIDYKFEYLESKKPKSFAISCWRSFRKLPIKTASCVFGALNTTIDTVFSPEIRMMIEEEKKIDFEELASEKTILFVVTSAVNPTLNCFINIFYSHVFKELFEFGENCPYGKLPIPVHVLCDDFAVGSTIHNFPEYISIFREKQISVTLLLQSESQLQSLYGSNDATTIINNCDSYLYLGGMDIKTCRNISERLNVPLDEVLYMPLGQAVVFRRGQRPIITKRYNILEDKRYQEVTKSYEKRVEKEREYLNFNDIIRF